MTDWAEDTARAAALALPPSDYGSTRAIQSVAALLRAERERGVRAGLAAAARVAGVAYADAVARSAAKGITKTAIYGWQERAVACAKVRSAIRSLDPTKIKETGDGRE